MFKYSSPQIISNAYVKYSSVFICKYINVTFFHGNKLAEFSNTVYLNLPYSFIEGHPEFISGSVWALQESC
jgi:hypothetical protein